MNRTECPFCGKEMDSQLVVCWECYRKTDRLQECPADLVAEWERLRRERHEHSK